MLLYSGVKVCTIEWSGFHFTSSLETDKWGGETQYSQCKCPRLSAAEKAIALTTEIPQRMT